MKNMIMSAIAGLMMVSMAHAEEQVKGQGPGPLKPTPGIEHFTLEQMNINPNSPLLGGQNFEGATVDVDQVAKQVVATFYRPMPKCPPGRMCPMFMPAPVIVRLPITYVGSGICGGLVIVAEKVLGVDTGLTKISLIDDSTNLCMHKTEEFTLNVTLTEENALRQEIVSTFVGK